ncbi:BTAD domain-containing putative transcriptional regulator [Parafrigoribacterium mesophilum]
MLVAAVGNPLPSLEQLNDIVTLTPDYGNVILASKVLPLIAWIAWAFFAVPMLIEVVASISGRTTKELPPAFRIQQYVAATLIAAVLFMITGVGSFAGTASPAWAAPILADASGGLSGLSPGSAATPTPAVEAQATPAEATPEPDEQPAAAITVTYQVVPGDTLWDIAEQYYGDGTRYVDIYHASTVTVQPDGARLTDPNLIRPGWVLTVPRVASPTAPTPTPTPTEPHSITSTGSVPDPVQPMTDSPAAANESSSPLPTAPSEEPADHGMELFVPLMTGGGIAGVLAGGILIELGRRRLRQRRNRAPGSRIAMPQRDASELELELRMIEDASRAEHVDTALRALQIWTVDTGSVLPDLFAVRLDEDEIQLYFGAPTSLPEPFALSNDDQTVWTISTSKVVAPIRETIAPYPALTTIGVDDNDGVLLLNLEHLSLLSIVGDKALCGGFLKAIAAELASSPWAEEIQITIIGMPAELGRSISATRVQHGDNVDSVLRNLRHDLDDRRSVFASLGAHGTRQSRAAGADTESWAPHVVIVGESIEPSAMRAFGELVTDNPDLGLVVVTNGPAESDCATVSIRTESQAELRLPGGTMPALPFKPQILQRRELELLQQLVDTTTRASKVPASAARLDDAGTVDSVEADPSDNGRSVGQPAPEIVANDEIQRVLDEPERVLDEPAWSGWRAPYLRLLGPVDMLNVEDEAAMPGRGAELIAYLNLNKAVDGRQLQHAFWPDTIDAGNNQRQLAKKVRVALGHTPEGQPLLPENTDRHGYSLHHAVRSDWDDFRAHTGNNPAAAETEDLVAALRLVRGQPFANCNTRRWWHWISIPEEEMIAAVLDTAEELAERALTLRDHSTARSAARVAQNVDPLNEAGWRIELRIALQTGDREGFEQILDDLYARVGGTDPGYDLDEATQQLVDRFTSAKATTK